MKKWLNNLMAGRYGSDELSFTLLMIYLGICILGIFVDAAFLQLIGLFIILFSLFRILSRNVEARRAENEAFMNFLRRTGKESEARKARRQDKDHRYFRCKNCGTVMRVPKGIGKIEITCPKCGEKITKKV